MATNEENRRGIGKTNETNRRNIGKNNEAQRRQIGRDNIERRTGVKQVQDINALVSPPRQKRTLQRKEPRGGLSGSVGVGNYTPPAAGTGGGIASPLTEKTKVVQDEEGNSKVVPDRDYYAGGFTSSDGLFILPAISVQRMTDASGADVQFIFANPQGTVPPETP